MPSLPSFPDGSFSLIGEHLRAADSRSRYQRRFPAPPGGETRGRALVRLGEQLVVRLRMSAGRAHGRGLGALVDIAAVAAYPADRRLAAEHAAVLDVGQQSPVARLVVCLDLADLAERRGDCL